MTPQARFSMPAGMPVCATPPCQAKRTRGGRAPSHLAVERNAATKRSRRTVAAAAAPLTTGHVPEVVVQLRVGGVRSYARSEERLQRNPTAQRQRRCGPSAGAPYARAHRGTGSEGNDDVSD